MAYKHTLETDFINLINEPKADRKEDYEIKRIVLLAALAIIQAVEQIKEERGSGD